jgi:hypothetical protein
LPFSAFEKEKTMGAVRDEILDAHPKGTVHPP